MFKMPSFRVILLARKPCKRNWHNPLIQSRGFVFIDPGVKYIGAYYRNVLLAQHLLPIIRNLALEGYSIFQHDSAPAHRAGGTFEVLRRDTLDFIPPTLRPPDSQDLNPV